MNKNKFLFIAAPLITLLMLFVFSSCEGGFTDPGHLGVAGLGDGGFSGGGSKECSTCDGSGKCVLCWGTGYGGTCLLCGGSGKCPTCKGTGKD